MKFWMPSAFVLLITISAMPALAGSSDKQKALTNSKRLVGVHKSMFEPLENSFGNASFLDHRQPNEQPEIVAEFGSGGQAPNIVEFGSVSGPVAAQPPTIRPSGMSNHVQEFSTLSRIMPGEEHERKILRQDANLKPSNLQTSSVQKNQLKNRSKISARTFSEESLWPPLR